MEPELIMKWCGAVLLGIITIASVIGFFGVIGLFLLHLIFPSEE